jgi:hypothetical protein
MEAEMVSEMLGFCPQLTQLVGREDFIEIKCCFPVLSLALALVIELNSCRVLDGIILQTVYVYRSGTY